MARTHCSANRRDGVRSLESIVSDAVLYFRNRGHRNDHAIEQVALALEMSPRRCRSLLYGEVFVTTAAELARVHAAFLRHLDAQADDLAARSEAARARRRQMELEL